MRKTLYSWFLGLAVAFAPAVVYVAVATHPSTTSWTFAAALTGLAATPLLRLVVKFSLWPSLVLMLMAVVVVPKMMWAVRLGYCGYNERQLVREQLDRYKVAHGRYPATLEEAGPVPALRIWTTDDQELEHIHPATRRVKILPGVDRAGMRPADFEDDGGWGYDSETGHVFTTCTGLEPKLRHHPLYTF